jgi:hypothetical protein
MASAIDLGTEPLAAPRDPFAGAPEEGIRLSDYARAVVSGGYGVIKDVAGAGQYVTGGDEQGIAAGARRWAEEGSQGQLEQSSPTAQRYLSAKWLPGGEGPTIWDKDVSIPHALGLQVASSFPSLAASLIPGGVVARVAKAAGAGVAAAGAYGAAAGGTAGGVLTGGDLFVDIQNDILKMPDEQLQKESDIYRGLRGMGMTEEDAKHQVVSSAAGLKPVYMAAITAFTSKYGVEGMLAKRVAEKGAATAGQGVIKGVLHGAAGEGSQEFIENASQELLTQKGAIDIRGGGQYDWHKALEEAVQGAVVGAVTGGVVGAGTRHSGVTHGDVDPAIEAALQPGQEPVQPALVPTGVTAPDPTVPVTVNQATVAPGQEMAGAHQAVQALGHPAAEVAHVSVTPTAPTIHPEIAPDVQAAIEAHYDTDLGEHPDAGLDLSVDDNAPVPPVPVVPVVAPEVARAIGAPIPASPQLAAEPASAPAPLVETAPVEAPGRPTEVAPAPVPAITPEPAPAPAVAETAPVSTGRVLTDVSQEKRSRKGPRMGKLKKAQLEAGATEVLDAKALAKQQRQQELTGIADRVRKAQEAMPEPPGLDAPTKTLRLYAQQLVDAAQVGETSLANLGADADPALRLIKAAKQVAKGAGSTSQVADFMVNDLDLRKGGEAIKEYAQSQAVKGGANVDEGIGSTETGTGAVRNAPEEQVLQQISRRQAPPPPADIRRSAKELKRARVGQKVTAEQAAAAAEETGKFDVAQDRTGKFQIETKRKKIIVPRGPDAFKTKRETGEATAKTEPEAAAALAEMRRVENQDVLPLRSEEDVRAKRELDRTLGVRRDTTATLGQILRGGQVFSETPGGVHKLMMVEMAGRLRRLAADVPVRIVDTRTMQEEWGRRKPVDDEGPLPHGFYDPNTDEIVVQHGRLTPEVIVHEGTHAAYSHALEDRKDVKQAVRSMMDAVERQAAHEALQRGEEQVEFPYGLQNEHEFIAEAFSNRAFQDLLMRTPATAEAEGQLGGMKRAVISVWDALIRNIKRALFGDGGPSHSVLEQVIRATQQLDQTAATQRSGAPLLASRSGSGRIADARAVLADQSEGGRMWWRRTGLKLATIDQIARQFRGKFQTTNGDGIERIQEALQRQEVFVGDKTAEGHKWAQRFAEIKQSNPDEAEKAARVMIDATTNNVNLGPNADNSHLGKDAARYYQNKKQLARLQAEYASLKPETQAFIQESAKYYRDTQNEMVKALIANVLNAHDTTLSPQAYAQLTRNTMNGTLSEDDAGIIDNEAVFNWLRGTQGLRVVKGIYFPLMRHGDIVVRTRDKVGDLHGGKVVETDKDGNVVVEWRAATDKAARAAYKSVAEATDNPITSVGKRRYLPDGTVVSEVDARGQTHELAYRARVQLSGVKFFDSAREAASFIRESKGDFDWTDAKPLDRADMQNRGDLTGQQFNALMSSLDRRSDIDSTSKALLKTTLQQASLRLMSGNRIQQRSLPRRGVRGASEDIARNTVQYATAASNYLGKIRYMPAVREAMSDMRALIAREPASKDMQLRNQVLNELVARVEQNVVNIHHPPQIVRDVMTLSFLDKLFSPGYSIINGMQPWMVTLPVLGGRYGPLRAGAALTRAYNSVGGLGALGSGIYNTASAVKNIRAIGLNTTDIVGSMRQNLAKESDGAQLTTMFDQLVERGLVSQEAGLEIAGAIASGRGVWGTGLSKVDRIARQLPVAVEIVNRATSAVAAFRLGKSAGMTEEQATAHAFDVVDQTQGDYRAFNQPRFFNKPWLSPALQFKKYAQLMTALTVDMVDRAAFQKGRERRVAIQQLASLWGVQIAMAGALSLPGLELLKAGAMIAAMLGVGDGWDDIERKLRKIFDDALGKDLGELVTRGVISRAPRLFGLSGVDLSSRVSLSDMWLFGEPKSNDRQGAQAYLFNFVGGAPASLLLDWAEGLRAAGEGDFGKAFIQMVPAKFIADTAKAVKGRYNRDITTPEAALQVAGFRSGRMAEEGEKVGEKVAINKKLEDERKQLQRQYLEANTEGERMKIKSRIIAHNNQAKETKNNRQMVFVKSLDSIRADKEAKRRALQGD